MSQKPPGRNAPAFPIQMPLDERGTATGGTCAGLTKRELIAAMALQGILSNQGSIDRIWRLMNEKFPNAALKNKAEASEQYIAETAKNCADALLKELAK